MTDYRSLKLQRKRNAQGQETIQQVEHITSAGAKLIMGGILVPGDVITTDTSTAPVLVTVGSICRIKVGATTYVTFGNDPVNDPVINVAVTATTTPALMLDAGTYLVVATDNFIRTSAAVARLEVLGFSEVA